tara:strand:+ start:117 stop:500 length:384 start_codon:yes stop_codon:yes gene_type:complete
MGLNARSRLLNVRNALDAAYMIVASKTTDRVEEEEEEEEIRTNLKEIEWRLEEVAARLVKVTSSRPPPTLGKGTEFEARVLEIESELEGGKEQFDWASNVLNFIHIPKAGGSSVRENTVIVLIMTTF